MALFIGFHTRVGATICWREIVIRNTTLMGAALAGDPDMFTAIKVSELAFIVIITIIIIITKPMTIGYAFQIDRTSAWILRGGAMVDHKDFISEETEELHHESVAAPGIFRW